MDFFRSASLAFCMLLLSVVSSAAEGPRINHPRVFGARPGAPFLFTVPVSGDRPMSFEATGLPDGLSLDPKTGRVSGVVTKPGDYDVSVTARNSLGSDRQTLRFTIGDRIALTPPMGWNSWNVWSIVVTADHVRAAADAMVEKGLINHGWTYINIDDGCLTGRDENGKLKTKQKFGDLPALCDYIHSLGLKVGIYSSPGPRTCAGYAGSMGHEAADARQFAEWGIDYLKHDWCSMAWEVGDNPTPEQMQAPYRLMGRELAGCGRDIVYSLCQYGMGDVWKWGGDLGGNCWRITGDLEDNWHGIVVAGFESSAPLAPFAGPGRWNDPDMLVVGSVGWGTGLRPSLLTPDEQTTHISQWCLLSAPLLLGCDLTSLDDFTLGLLTNDEVIAVNQDPLGRQASRVSKDGPHEVWAKELSDGSTAVGLFNLGEKADIVRARWSDLRIEGPQQARDLWRQRDLGQRDGFIGADVAPHGVVLIRLDAR